MNVYEAKVILAEVKIQFQPYLKRNSNFLVSMFNTREDLSIDVSITNIGLILTKLR